MVSRHLFVFFIYIAKYRRCVVNVLWYVVYFHTNVGSVYFIAVSTTRRKLPVSMSRASPYDVHGAT